MNLALARRPALVTVEPDEAFVALQGVTKVFGHGKTAFTALQDVSLEVARGEFLCILGASGCGKSTLLSMIAGLDKPTEGTIDIADGRPAVMFQDPGLLPWLTVRRNVELPMRIHKVSSVERDKTVNRLLAHGRPARFRGKPAASAVRWHASALRAGPRPCPGLELLLMDEPFAALDAITRDQLHDDLNRIWQETGRTVIFVTHNVREAVRLGDKVMLMTPRPGRVAQTWDVEITPAP